MINDVIVIDVAEIFVSLYVSIVLSSRRRGRGVSLLISSIEVSFGLAVDLGLILGFLKTN